MKTKLMTFLSLSMLLASCAQDDTRDNVLPNKQQSGLHEGSSSRIGNLTTVKLLQEVHNPSVLKAGEAITLVQNDRKYQLIMQYDNNLVLYMTRSGHTSVLWSSNSYSSTGGYSQLIAQNDGNMVIYRDGIPTWNTNKTVNFHVNDPHMKLQVFSRSGTFITPGYRMKFVLGGNNQNINDVFEVDFD
ncbi:hypothetical protein [Chryseobacterium pennipullorum]|uniref:Bulb-type lectin domain-containing protein n=1 Tax=Chryseobacterium pennipullorum TaxID=2258963 RepID=A0A3D9APB6_9FLAO|nr:hypothetical protein [Chryseobacterium pennipullorum]REC42877.1 hypothetical protein DRF67_19950 [Chryseobacterium pennipullorum]